MKNFLEFNKNPFSKYSAEEELDIIEDIFHKPNYYNTLLDDLKSGSSRFILGQRGNGKSSLVHYLKRDLERDKLFTIIVDKFDGVPISNNDKELLELVIKSIVKKLSIHLIKNKIDFKGLSKIEKDKLIIYINLFFDTISKKEFGEVYNKIGKVKSKNIIRRIWNVCFVKNVNGLTNAAVNISSQFISNSLGYTNNTLIPYNEYFTEIKEIEIGKTNIRETALFNYNSLKEILTELVDIIKKLSYTGTVILFDKIDEFKVLNQDLNRIVEFTKDILTDTELLLQDNISIGFSLWTEIRYLLNAKGVRFDKFKEIDVSWSKEDLEKIINKRLQYYSQNPNYTLDRLIRDKATKEEVIDLANKSPRDLIRLLSCIYDIQLSRNMKILEFGENNISKGMINFAKNYDYISVNPSQTGSNNEVMTYIRKLLLTRQLQFDLQTMNNTLNLKPAKTSALINKMLQYGIIIENEIGKAGDITLYNVVDPKLKYLIRKSIINLEN